MGEREQAFRKRIARIERIQQINEKKELYSKENEEIDKPNTKDNYFDNILPAICGVKKSIENFSTKETIKEER